MKFFQKNLLSIGFLFSTLCGIVFSFTTQNVQAQEFLNEMAIPVRGDRIPCWNQGAKKQNSLYVECITCTKIIHYDYDPFTQDECTTTSP